MSNQIIQIESHNNFIRSEKRIIATIGIEDLIIIDNDNATLITKKNYSEKVKLVVNELLQRGLVEGKKHTFENRPWGKFENLLDDNSCKVKRIVVKPKKRLSLQYHNFRSEHWLVVTGKANVHLDGKNLVLFAGESIDIPTKSHHYIENKENEDLIIIETQLGSYFGEDDIIRLDDPYSR
ncbi:cupin domain-containing protein [Alphaproteobacteria bacterium]|nr:cupin domain-containing protein [Alphaproteobacteria bacterium]